MKSQNKLLRTCSKADRKVLGDVITVHDMP